MYNPLLPPKIGYVEVIDSDGNHIYQKTQELIDKELADAEKASQTQQMTSIQSTLDAVQASIDGMSSVLNLIKTALHID